MRFVGDFEGMSEPERDSLLLDLAGIAQRSSGLCLASPTYPVTAAQRTTLTEDPYFRAVEACVTVAMQIVRSLDKDDPALAFVCDFAKYEEMARCLEVFNGIRMRHRDFQKTLTSIIFGADEEFPIVQISDMFAFCYRESLGKVPARPIITQLYHTLCNGQPIISGMVNLPRDVG
jgi:hypothetical protein